MSTEKKENSLKKIIPALKKNNNLVESIRINELKKTSNESDKINEFLLARYVYNRGLYHFYDHIIEKQMIEAQKKVYIIQQEMLTDEEAENILGSNINKRDTVFLKSRGLFTLKELAPNKTLIVYEYKTTTDHWLLNKSVSISTFFESTAKSLAELMEQLTLSALKHSSQKHVTSVSKNI